jgi:predicted GH43/DUF377 family glycosyl hydrolase
MRVAPFGLRAKVREGKFIGIGVRGGNGEMSAAETPSNRWEASGQLHSWVLKGFPEPRDAGHPAHRELLSRSNVYNPGVVRWNDGYLMACRIGGNYNSSVWIGELDARYRPMRRTFVEVIPYHRGESYEDPRLFVHDGDLMMSCVLAREDSQHQCLCRIEANLRATQFREIASPKGARYDKNWVFFGYEGRLHLVYHAGQGRQEIYSLAGNTPVEAFCTTSPIRWRWGEVRGGSNAVLFEGNFWTFFHSRFNFPSEVRYYMGAYAFEARPPFGITLYTPEPLYTPAARSQYLGQWRPHYVVFPGGLIKDGDDWLVFSGHNDEQVIASRISHCDLRALMVAKDSSRADTVLTRPR